MVCEHCKKEVQNINPPQTLLDKQCFNCGSILTDQEIDNLKAQLNG